MQCPWPHHFVIQAPIQPERRFLFADYRTGVLSQISFQYMWQFLWFLEALFYQELNHKIINPLIGYWN
jgi:hypothetical protein